MISPSAISSCIQQPLTHIRLIKWFYSVRNFSAPSAVAISTVYNHNPNKKSNNNSRTVVANNTIKIVENKISSKNIKKEINNVSSSSSDRLLYGWEISLTNLIKPAPDFKDLRISSYLCHKLASMKYNKPTIIQTAAIPHLTRTPYNSVEYSDIIIEDITGQGKTLSYLLPILSQIDNYLNELQALIIVPTRELAVQINNVIESLLLGGNKNRALHPIIYHTLVGNVNPSMISELNRLNSNPITRPHIIIGTPNSVCELLVQQKIMNVSQLKYIIFDEIDNLISGHDTRPYITPLIHTRPKLNPSITASSTDQLKASQPRTQIVFVSASITPAVLDLASIHLSSNRKLITPASVPAECERRGRSLQTKIPSRLKHYYIIANRPHPRHILLQNLILAIRKQYKTHLQFNMGLNTNNKLIESPHLKQATAVFFNNHDNIVPHINPINQLGFNIGLLTERSNRSERRDSLKPGKNEIIFCTDIFSRGMDFSPLTHIINYDIPKDYNIYLHRAGRVGRLSSLHANSANIITIIEPDNKEHITKLKQFQSNLNIPNWTRIYLRGGKVYTTKIKNTKQLKPQNHSINASSSDSILDYEIKSSLSNNSSLSSEEYNGSSETELDFIDDQVQIRSPAEFNY